MRLPLRSLFICCTFAPTLVLAAQDSCKTVASCDGANLCASSDNAGEAGAWTVGARTLRVNKLNVEVWYPAALANPTPFVAKKYDLRQWLPASEQQKIPDAEVPEQICNCSADLPFDSVHGPYPVILFAHGTAAFRTQSLSLMTQLASRGYVVIAADHPGLFLGDLLQFKIFAHVKDDLKGLIRALRSEQPEFDFLKGRVQLNHIGLIGHSAGGVAIAEGLGLDGVEFLVPLAAGGTTTGPDLRSSLVMGAVDDKVVNYSRQQKGFASSPSPKRLIALKNAGHLAFSDLCALKNSNGDDLVKVAQNYKIKNASFASQLWDGCADGQLESEKASAIINYSVTAAAAEVLQCDARKSQFEDFQSRFTDVAEFKEVF